MDKTKGKDLHKAVRNRGMVLIAIGTAVMGLAVFFLLHIYQNKNEEIFRTLIEENLTSTHQGQASDIRGIIRETGGLLEKLADVYADTAEGGGSGAYLEAIRELEYLYEVDYYPAEGLQEALKAAGLTEGGREIRNRLEKGETVVSDIFLHGGKEPVYVFSILAPAERDGSFTGVFCAYLNADLLLWTSEKQKYDHADNMLLRRGGELILDGSDYVEGLYNLYDDLEEMKIPEAKVELVRDAMQSDETRLVVLKSPRQGEFYMLTSPLGYNDWMLLSITHSNEVRGYAAPIMKNTVLLVAVLLIFLALLLGSGWCVYARQREKILHSQARYELLAEFSDTVLFIYDCAAKNLVFTPNITSRYQIPKSDVIRPFDGNALLTLLHPQDAEILRDMLKNTDQFEQNHAKSITLRFHNREGEYRWMRCQGQLLQDKHGMPLSVVGKLSDVHEMKAKEQELIENSSADALTGALNRRAAQERIEELLTHVRCGFLFMLDVDDFKKINDSRGHTAGDVLLARLVEGIRKEFRQEDITGRIGGDEFVIFMPDTGDAAVACQKAESLLARLAALGEGMSVSIGIAAFPADGGTYQALYEKADAAMYQAKKLGKHRYSLFTETSAGS